MLLDAVPDSVALRASIVIGARSRSFRFLVHLVERLPVLTLPAWRNFRTQPIDARDIIEMLVASATAPVTGRSLDVGGPDVLTYGEMVARIAELMLVHRPSLGFGLSVTPLTARLAAAIAGEDPELGAAADGGPAGGPAAGERSRRRAARRRAALASTRPSNMRSASGRNPSRWPRADG